MTVDVQPEYLVELRIVIVEMLERWNDVESEQRRQHEERASASTPLPTAVAGSAAASHKEAASPFALADLPSTKNILHVDAHLDEWWMPPETTGGNLRPWS